MLKDKALFIPFIAFILLHIGQWMYTMNMPLFVTEYLKRTRRLCRYFSKFMCWLRGAFYGYIRDFSIQIIYTHFAYTRAISGGLFYFSIGIFENIYDDDRTSIFSILFSDFIRTGY